MNGSQQFRVSLVMAYFALMLASGFWPMNPSHAATKDELHTLLRKLDQTTQ